MFLPEFKKLRKKPDRAFSLPDLLNYAAFVAPGTILMKDGALLAGFAYAGPDLNSSSPEELASLTQHVNSALARFGDGWMLNVDLIRHESASYPEDGGFPDPTTRLIDRERQIHYTAERRHFETSFALTTTFRPPPDLHQKSSASVLFGQRLGDRLEPHSRLLSTDRLRVPGCPQCKFARRPYG
jgi:type IV secretion system protein TrbE